MFFYLLGLSVPPSIRDSSGDSPVVVNVLVGKSLTLECESNAVPPPTITWYKNGRVVTQSAKLRILADGQMLEIKDSEVTDELMLCHILFSISSVAINSVVFGLIVFFISIHFWSCISFVVFVTFKFV